MEFVKGEFKLRGGAIERVAFDVLAVLAACFGAQILVRLYVNGPDLSGADGGLLSYFLLTTVLVIAAYAAVGVYTLRKTFASGQKATRMMFASAGVFLLVATLFAALQTSDASDQLMFALAWSLSALMSVGARYAVQSVGQEAYREVSRTLADEQENKVLVIGGGGYIGSALIPKLLNAGYHVVVLDKLYFGDGPISEFVNHPNVEIVREDFRNIEVLVREVRRVGPIIHLGGLVGDPACAVDPELTIDVNVTSTRLIGEIARANGNRRFIFASSCSVYGASPDIVNETSSFNPQSLYAQTKVASEAVLSELYNGKFCPTYLRFATIYGLSGRTRFDLVANLLCAKAVRDGEITIFGSDQWRPFIHVDDVAEAVYRSLKAPLHLVANKAFNVGSNEQNMTLMDLGQRIQNLVPAAKIVVTDENVDRRNYRVNFDRIRTVLDFKPRWTLEMGLEQILAAVRSGSVGDYTGVNYSNVRFLRQAGTESLIRRYNTGWEQNYLYRVDNDTTLQSGGSEVPATAAR